MIHINKYKFGAMASFLLVGLFAIAQVASAASPVPVTRNQKASFQGRGRFRAWRSSQASAARRPQAFPGTAT